MRDFIQPLINRCRYGSTLEDRECHAQCNDAAGHLLFEGRLIPELPRRVLDVGEKGRHAKLYAWELEWQNQMYDHHVKFNRSVAFADYLALSYCWGKSNEQSKTTLKNFHQHLHKVNVDKLSQTIQDAIDISRALGIRFLYVDALCIIQPEDRNQLDWETESRRMGDYYRRATCTIAAMAATDSSEGIIF